MPSPQDLQDFRDLLIQANNDPMFTIITHYAVNVDAIGLNGKLLPISTELARIDEEILMALFANQAVTTGNGPNFSTASIAFRSMMSRYIPIRARLERFLYQKVFAPVAYANKFYKRKEADLAHKVRTGEGANALIIPQIDWRSKSNLLDDGTTKSIIASAVNSGRLPMKIMIDALDLDYDEVRNYLYSEQASVFDPIAQKARGKMVESQQDSTLIGQPFLPKTNSPVSVPPVQPQAKKASKFGNLLTIKPLKDGTQTQINKGVPKMKEPEVDNFMNKSMEIETASRVFGDEDDAYKKPINVSAIEKQYKERKKMKQTSSIVKKEGK